jgi:CHAT domain-containing protein/exonuclease VII small subunit
LNHPTFSATPKRFQLIALNDGGGVFLRRYWAAGRPPDLNRALRCWEQAVEQTPSGSPDLPGYLNNLGVALRTRFEALGQVADLDAAIAAFKAALDVAREGSPDWAMYQANLGNALSTRFEARGQVADLDAAIAAYEKALDVAREGSPDWAKMQANLGNALRTRFEARGQVADLDAAIAAYEKALDVAREGSPDWASRQANLGVALRTRFEALGQVQDLDAAIAAYEKALDVAREGSPDWASRQANLGVALRTRGDTDGAIEAYRKALEVFTPETYPDYTLTAALPLGRLLMGRGQDEDLDDAARVYRAARSAADYLYFESLHQVRRKRELSRIQGMAANQAYALAHEGDHREAIAALEAGRARALAESLLGQRALETVAAPAEKEALEAAWRSVQQAQSVYNQADEEEPRRRAERQLAQARRAYYDRMRDAFPDYFDPPTFDQVQAAAADAPLVYLAVTPAGGLALVMTPSQSSSEPSVHPIWLDDLSDEALRERLVGITEEEWREISARWEKGEATEQDIQKISQGYLGAYNAWRRNPRDGAARAAWLEAIDETTRWLWDAAMGPVVEALTDFGNNRATLIPAGLLGLLPLHAAWTEDPAQPTGRRYALDEIRFTTTPNARALTASRTRAAGRDAEGLLAVDEPQPVSASPLPSSSWETAAACDHFPDDERTRLLGGEAATKEGVLEAMPRYPVLHLSCHGFANPAEPLESGLLMAHDQRLTLRDVQALQLERARLAVLSACETRFPGADLPDEVVALPTGLVQAGVPGVVGSLWSVLDLSTAMLMVRFYDLWRGDDLPPAEALRQAQIWLRDTTNAQKADYFGTELPELSAARMPVPLADALFKEAALKNPEERAFAHPFHWAAFAFTGV